MTEPAGDEGFVMIDALVAVAILGIVGTGVLALASGLLAAQERQLDRSMALLTAEMLAQQYAELGPASGSRVEDEAFVYEIVAGDHPPDGTRLRPMVVIVRTKGQESAEVLRFDFLSAARSSS